MWNTDFEVLQIEIARNVVRVSISKMAKAMSNLLKVFRRCFCMRIMIKMMFPNIPKIATTSLLKRSTQDANISCSSHCGLLLHSNLVSLSARTLDRLDHAALVLMLNSSKNQGSWMLVCVSLMPSTLLKPWSRFMLTPRAEKSANGFSFRFARLVVRPSLSLPFHPLFIVNLPLPLHFGISWRTDDTCPINPRLSLGVQTGNNAFPRQELRGVLCCVRQRVRLIGCVILQNCNDVNEQHGVVAPANYRREREQGRAREWRRYPVSDMFGLPFIPQIFGHIRGRNYSVVRSSGNPLTRTEDFPVKRCNHSLKACDLYQNNERKVS